MGPRLRPDSRLPGPRPRGRKFAFSFTMGKSLIILILVLFISTLALSTGTTGAFSETLDVIDVDDDQDMIHMNEIPEVDEDNEVLEAHFLGNLGAKIIADDFATTRAHFASKAAFIAKEADFIGAKLSGDAGLLGAPLADVEKVKHGVSLGEKLEDDFAAARAHFSSKANVIASKAGSIGAQLSSGTGLAGAPFVKLASAARERFEFLNGAGAGTRTGQVGNLKHGVKTLKHGVKKGAENRRAGGCASRRSRRDRRQEGAEAWSQDGEARRQEGAEGRRDRDGRRREIGP